MPVRGRVRARIACAQAPPRSVGSRLGRRSHEVAAVADGLPIEIKDGRPCVHSRAVATHFEKRHDNVVRDIDALISHAADLRHEQFQEVSRPHPTVKGRNDRSFYLDRDGFTLLVMGYTGPLALTFKLAYLRRFNAMEAELRERTQRLALPAPSMSAPVPGLEQVVASLAVVAQALHGPQPSTAFQ